MENLNNMEYNFLSELSFYDGTQKTLLSGSSPITTRKRRHKRTKTGGIMRSPLNLSVGRERLEAAWLFIQFKSGTAILPVGQVQGVAGSATSRRNSTAVVSPPRRRRRQVVVELAAVIGGLLAGRRRPIAAVDLRRRGSAAVAVAVVTVVAGIVPVKRRALAAVHPAV